MILCKDLSFENTVKKIGEVNEISSCCIIQEGKLTQCYLVLQKLKSYLEINAIAWQNVGFGK